jgi:hypothetical protein
VGIYVQPDETFAQNAMDKLRRAGEKPSAGTQVESLSKAAGRRVERIGRKPG